MGLVDTDVVRRRQFGKHCSHCLLSLVQRINGPELEPRPDLPKEQLSGPTERGFGAESVTVGPEERVALVGRAHRRDARVLAY